MRVPVLNVARVWCGALPRRGSGQNAGTHMRVCVQCRRARRAFEAAIWAQHGEISLSNELAAGTPLSVVRARFSGGQQAMAL